MSRRWIAVGALLAVMMLAASACSSDSSTTDTGGTTAPSATGGGGGGSAETMTIKDFAFDPSTLTVSGSTTIEITNEDDAEHSFTLDDDSVSQDVEPGATETVTIDPAASIGFHCEFHPEMTGSITVG